MILLLVLLNDTSITRILNIFKNQIKCIAGSQEVKKKSMTQNEEL